MNSTKSFEDLVNMVTVPRDPRRLDEFIVDNEAFLDRALQNDAIASEDFEICLGSLTLHLTDQDTVLDNFDHMTKASDNISVKILDQGEWVTGDEHGLKWQFSDLYFPKLVGTERTYSKENSVFFHVTDAKDPAYWCLVIIA